MPKKITKKIPVEKLSEKEVLVEIEDSDSSSEEESEIAVPPPPKIAKPKKERTAKQLANDQRLREAAEARRNAKKEVKPVSVKKDKKVKIVEPEPEPTEDPDDKPMTVKQMKAFLESQKESHTVQAAPKQKRKYTKRAKPPAPTPPLRRLRYKNRKYLQCCGLKI